MCKPLFEYGADARQFVIGRYSTVIRSQNHLAVLIHALLAGYIFGIQSQKQCLLAQTECGVSDDFRLRRRAQLRVPLRLCLR
jgi:hypothetical protein